MFDNKTLKVQSAQETLFPRLKCVCVCARAWAAEERAPKRTGKLHFELRARPNDQIHTKYVQMAGYESIHLNTVYVLNGPEQLGENPMCQYIVLKWQTGAWTINVIKEKKCKEKITHSS